MMMTSLWYAASVMKVDVSLLAGPQDLHTMHGWHCCRVCGGIYVDG